MIKSFRDPETQKVFARQHSRKLPHDIQQVAYRKLRMLSNAQNLADLRVPPANRLEKLSGNRAGQRSIRINDQWRICFEWCDGEAYTKLNGSCHTPRASEVTRSRELAKVNHDFCKSLWYYNVEIVDYH